VTLPYHRNRIEREDNVIGIQSMTVGKLEPISQLDIQGLPVRAIVHDSARPGTYFSVS